MHLYRIRVRSRYVLPVLSDKLAKMDCSSYFPTRGKETLGSQEGVKAEQYVRVLPLVPAEATVSRRSFCQALR